MKVLLKRFHLNGNTIGFSPQTSSFVLVVLGLTKKSTKWPWASPGVGVTLLKSGNAQVTKNVSHMEEQLYSIVILLPLHPASLTHKKCKRNKIIHGMCPMGRKGQLIDLKM